MRFTLILRITSRNRILPINYQYPLHSWIYKVIQSANAEFSRFLHDEGYRLGHKSFKLFTFSPLTCLPYKIYPQEQRIALQGQETTLQISFMISQAAEHFIRGLFAGQQFSLGDEISQVAFEVARIEAHPRPVFTETMCYRCLSPIVISTKTEGRTHAQYLHPEEEQYPDLFLRHLVQKHAAAVDAAAVNAATVSQLTDINNIPEWEATERSAAQRDAANWQFRLLNKPRKKGIHIKQHSREHTKVIGYLYDFELTAPPEVHEMAYYAGFGEKNSLGFGMCEDIKD